MISIWQLKDYYAVGEEGQKKWFVPTLDDAVFVAQTHFKKRISLTSETKIRTSLKDLTLQEFFNG